MNLLRVARLTIVLVLCIFTQVGNSSADELIAPAKLYGTWHLLPIDQKPTENYQIKSHSIELSSDGTWRFASEMTGKYAGMQLEGSGKWSLNGNVFRYTAGNNSGVANILFQGELMKFSPDPVIMPNGSKPAITTYSR